MHRFRILYQSFDSTDPSDKKLASFDAKLELHNTNESVEDVLLVDLKSPNVFIHSNAIDRAILVYLNYRSAYQSWKEEIDRTMVNASKNVPMAILKEKAIQTATVVSSSPSGSKSGFKTLPKFELTNHNNNHNK